MLQLGGLLKKLQLRTFLFKRDREERNLRSCQLRSINHVEASLSNEDVFPIGEKQSLISGSLFVPVDVGIIMINNWQDFIHFRVTVHWY